MLPLERLPDPLPIAPLAGPFDLAMTPPGSKSITNRAYVLAALAAGTSRIARPLRADDTDGLLDALVTLGARAEWDGDDVVVHGVAGRFPRGGEVNLGDGGTPTRFMIAVACLADAPVVVDGSPRMRERPVAEGIGFLRRLGATIEHLDADGHLPVRVSGNGPGGGLAGGRIEIPTTLSSQFVSALLLVAPFLSGGLRLDYTGEQTSAAYVELTRRVLAAFGGRLARVPSGDAVAEGAIEPTDYAVEPDASGAAYWLAAAAVTPGAAVTIPGLPPASSQPDVAVAAALAAAGAEVDGDGDALRLAAGAGPGPLDDDCAGHPDGAVALAAVAARAHGVSTLGGLHTLRVKESDRIAALATELRRVGCTVVATDDALVIDPAACHDEPVVIETYGDHRIAMAFAVLGLARPGISIANPACAGKSYRTFYRDLARLYG
jgi:3-phosphoshikimate 1-carboxyvinyltransferase